MLKFYALRVQHDSLSRSVNGRYFIVTDGRWIAGYNEERYESSLFGAGAHRLDVGDNPSPTELAAAIKASASSILSGLLMDYMALYQARIDADDIVETLDGGLDMGWFMRTDVNAVQRTLEYLYYRLWADTVGYEKRMHREVRLGRYIERFMVKAKALHTNEARPALVAHYKGHSLVQRTYKAIRAQRRNINVYVKASIITQDFDTGELIASLRALHGIRANFITGKALERYEELGFDEIEQCDCGHLEVADDTHEVRNDTWCDACFREDAVHVEDVDEYWPRDDAYYHENDDLYYSYEERRSSAWGEDDDDEDGDSEPQDLMSYSTNVLRHISSDANIQSSKFGNFTMGVELEMCAGSRSSVDEAVADVRARLGEDYIICKSDGSLPNDGFEIVTAPRGLDEHIRRFKAWDVKPTYRAWNAKQCGLHVHMDSRAFTQMTLGKFLMFINADCNADFIRSLAGRHPKIDDQARSYCAAEDQSIITDPLKAVKGKGANRYRMVNVTNMDQGELVRLGLNWRQYDTSGRKFNTVELRIFRASLKKERLLAQIEFAHAAVMFVRAASYRDLTEGTFKGWLAKSHVLYPHLAAWYEVVPKKKANPNVAAVVAADETVA
jgi:hypothetical protein